MLTWCGERGENPDFPVAVRFLLSFLYFSFGLHLFDFAGVRERKREFKVTLGELKIFLRLKPVAANSMKRTRYRHIMRMDIYA